MKVAHRCGMGLYPENSLSAIKNSLEYGFDAVEIDVRLTKDLKVVAYNDDRLNFDFTSSAISTASSSFISELTYEELLDYEIGIKKSNTRYSIKNNHQKDIYNEKIPLLEDAIKTVKLLSDKALMLIDLKCREKLGGSDKELCRKVFEVCQKENFLARVVFCGTEWSNLLEIKRISPISKVWALTPEIKKIKNMSVDDRKKIFAGADPVLYEYNFKAMIKDLSLDGWLYHKSDRHFVKALPRDSDQIEIGSWGWLNSPRKNGIFCSDFVESYIDPFFFRDPLSAANIPLSVIVTTYNVQDYLDQALSSVISQATSFGSFEIILVDDGSSDNTVSLAIEKLSSWASKKIIVQSNSGAGGARNTGLLAAKGKYVCFLDGDDYFQPNSFEALYNEIENSNSNVVLSNRRKYYEKNKSFKTDEDKHAYFVGDQEDIGIIKARIPIHGKIFNRKFLLENKVFFPEKMSVEDFVFHYECLSKLSKFSIISNVTYVWRKRGGGNTSLTQDRLSNNSLESRFRQIELTQNLVRAYDFKNKIPGINHLRTDYQYRLMRHIMALGNIETELQKNAFYKISDFIQKNKNFVFKCIKPDVLDLYSAILDKDELRTSRELKAYLERIRS